MAHGTAMINTVPRPSVRELSRELGVPKSTMHRWLKALGSCSSSYYSSIAKAYALLRARGLAFYTLPPGNMVWTWILVNAFTIDSLEKLLNIYRDIDAKILSVIVDAGVDKLWRKPYQELPIDYDSDYWNTFWSAVDMVKQLSKKNGFSYEIVVPDYPDDYAKAWGKAHSLWLEECCDTPTNISRTIENIFYLIDYDRKTKWLVPVQGYEDNPESLALNLADLVDRLGYKRYRFGLANLCTSRRSSVVVETIRLAREVCPQCSLHIFGPGLSGIRSSIKQKLLKPGDSWDSTAWTYPRVGKVWSCKNSFERELYFALYLENIARGLGSNA